MFNCLWKCICSMKKFYLFITVFIFSASSVCAQSGESYVLQMDKAVMSRTISEHEDEDFFLLLPDRDGRLLKREVFISKKQRYDY